MSDDYQPFERGAPLIKRRFFGSGKESFGKRGRPKHWRYVIAALLLVTGIVIGLRYLGNLRSAPDNSAKAVVGEDSFDPIKDYAAVRDNGTLDQLMRLLLALKDRKPKQQEPAILIDNFSKLEEVSTLILNHENRTQKQRQLAAKTQIDALWRIYRINRINRIDEPATAARLLAVTKEFLDDPDRVVSRDAHVIRTMGLAGEAARQSTDVKKSSVEESMIAMLKKFPDDPLVLDSMRRMFTSIRAVNQSYAMHLIEQVQPVLKESSSQRSRQLARFMADIVLLYDTGIGNLSSIDAVSVDDIDFLARLERLNSDLGAGTTVVQQLENAIYYYERVGKHELARQVSQNVLDSAPKRTDPVAAKLAELVGQSGLKRNQLPGQPWDFVVTAADGTEIDGSRFEGNVVVILFFDAIDPASDRILRYTERLLLQLAGKPIELIGVAVGPASANTPRLTGTWLTLQTGWDRPNRYLQQCPANQFPYFVLVDKSGRVGRIFVRAENVKTEIESLLSKQ